MRGGQLTSLEYLLKPLLKAVITDQEIIQYMLTLMNQKKRDGGDDIADEGLNSLRKISLN